MLDEIRRRLDGVPFEIAFNHGTHDRQYGLYPIPSQPACLPDFRVTSSRPDNTEMSCEGRASSAIADLVSSISLFDGT